MCPTNQSKVKEVYLVVKKMFDGLKLKCKFGCEVPLLSYNKHIEQCSEDVTNNPIPCWNCGNTTKLNEMKVKDESQLTKYKKEIDLIKNDKKEYVITKEEEISKLNIQINKYECKLKELELSYDKEIKEITCKFEKEISSYKNELHELKIKNNELNELIELVKLKNKSSCLDLIKNGDKIPLDLNIIDIIDKISKIDTSFDSKNNKNNIFKFSNNNKNLLKISKNECWNGIFCVDKIIINEGIFEFSIQINFCESYADIAIGFAIMDSNTNNSSLCNSKNSWMCNLQSGKFCNGGKYKDYFWNNKLIKPTINDIISICFDTKEFQLYMKINGKTQSKKYSMSLSEQQKNSICGLGKLYPCIDMYNINDQIQLIS